MQEKGMAWLLVKLVAINSLLVSVVVAGVAYFIEQAAQQNLLFVAVPPIVLVLTLMQMHGLNRGNEE